MDGEQTIGAALWRARGRMGARSATAVVGGYAAGAAISSLWARLMPIDRVEATAWAMTFSFAIYAGLLLWAFHEPRLARVATVIWGLSVLCGGAAWLMGPPV